jgi:hypothetical protein
MLQTILSVGRSRQTDLYPEKKENALVSRVRALNLLLFHRFRIRL